MSTAAIVDLQLSAAFVCRREIDQCAAHLQSAVVLAEQLGLALVRALALCHLAHCSAFKGDSAESGRLAALALPAMPGDAELEAFCLCARGIIPLLDGDRHGAIEALSPGMAILARLPQAAPAAIRAMWPLLLASAGTAKPRPRHWLAESRDAFTSHDLHRLAEWSDELLAGPPPVPWAGLGITNADFRTATSPSTVLD